VWLTFSSSSCHAPCSCTILADVAGVVGDLDLAARSRAPVLASFAHRPSSSEAGHRLRLLVGDIHVDDAVLQRLEVRSARRTACGLQVLELVSQANFIAPTASAQTSARRSRELSTSSRLPPSARLHALERKICSPHLIQVLKDLISRPVRHALQGTTPTAADFADTTSMSPWAHEDRAFLAVECPAAARLGRASPDMIEAVARALFRVREGHAQLAFTTAGRIWLLPEKSPLAMHCAAITVAR